MKTAQQRAQQRFYIKNRPRLLEKQRKYNKEHAEHIKEYQDEYQPKYRAAHREYFRRYQIRRNAKKRSAKRESIAWAAYQILEAAL